MSDKEVIIPHDQISDPQTITPVMKKILAESGMDMKRDKIKVEDSNNGDDQKGVRIIRSNRRIKYFDMGRGRK